MVSRTNKKGARWDIFLYHVILFVVVHGLFVFLVGVLPLSELGSTSYLDHISDEFWNHGVNIYKNQTVNIFSGIWKTILIVHLIVEIVETLFPTKKKDEETKEVIVETKTASSKVKKMSPSRAWLYLIIAGLLEIIWATALKLDLLAGPLLITLILSLELLIRAVKHLGVGTAYAVFTGMGTIGLVVVDVIVFQETMSVLKLLFILLLVISIIGLKWTSGLQGDENR